MTRRQTFSVSRKNKARKREVGSVWFHAMATRVKIPAREDVFRGEDGYEFVAGEPGGFDV